MKKIFNLILAALVIIGAASCTKNEEVAYQGGESLSFYAEIVNGDTRAYIDDTDGDKIWNTIWEEGDQVRVTDGYGNAFIFTYGNGKFTCTADGVTSLIGQTVTIDPESPTLDSAAGIRGWSFDPPMVTFAADMTVQLEADTSFFRYTYNGEGEVTITVDAGTSKVFIVGGVATNTITFAAIPGENFVPFWTKATKLDATLSYSIDDVKSKQTDITLYRGKVYNLGTLTDPETIYLVPNADWMQADAWFAAHFYNAVGGYADVKMTDADADGIYECKVPVDMTNVIFCRMNPAYTEFGWNSDAEPEHIWNQIENLTVGAAPNNYFYITDWTAGEWHEANYEFEQYKVYVYQYENTWSPLNLYCWNVDTSATYAGGWPGSASTTTETINGYAYKVWELPIAATGESVKVILNNGSSQTGDSDTYTINGDLYLLLRGTAISVIEDPNNPEPTVELQARSIYATTTLSWSNMNIYAWGAGLEIEWPGAEMSVETINDTKYYVYTFDKSLDGSTLSGVIFNDNSSQTVDITNVKLDKDRFFKVLDTKSGNNYNYQEIEDPR